MIKILIPVFIIGIIAVTVLIIHRRESKVGELKRLRNENKTLKSLVDTIDRDAYAEYTVTNSPFAGTVLDAIRRHDSSTKEIA